jgi:hypothetical protein
VCEKEKVLTQSLAVASSPNSQHGSALIFLFFLQKLPFDLLLLNTHIENFFLFSHITRSENQSKVLVYKHAYEHTMAPAEGSQADPGGGCNEHTQQWANSNTTHTTRA